MDSLTHNVRRANWLNIINQCQERPANVTVRQWLKDNDINEKFYYYWLRNYDNDGRYGASASCDPSADCIRN